MTKETEYEVADGYNVPREIKIEEPLTRLEECVSALRTLKEMSKRSNVDYKISVELGNIGANIKAIKKMLNK